MEIQTIEGLYPASNRMVVRTTTTFHRYLYELIKWNACMIGIKGARGVGKTTMLLQRIHVYITRCPVPCRKVFEYP